ncbi:hypothetical protein IC220_06105 [Wolbachia endosymbiont of Pentalonia nigronervosa]|jgi:opacity protein-like surface antigen|uniref:hypothetical protein n=1 Tax=Wolbachia endosymbiont of Pentalonia nigronervosa TaxID=1301914 RepID=UPI00165FB1E6|nr:hypothetical protein [Wolbachia endosymbiont of Pentalonia nigronervosa]MBD0391990.1 hypothetical protein [Wolbachia endosymbiont of Pentalonia nigronervosa]
MKKLLASTILSAVFLATPCFGIDDVIRDRVFASLSYSAASAGFDVGYHYTDNLKFSLGSMIKTFFDMPNRKIGVGTGLMAKLHYHHTLESTGITPYVYAGAGIARTYLVKEGSQSFRPVLTPDYLFSYQVGAGINLPLSSKTNILAGYRIQKLDESSHGFEFGISFNL